MSEPYTMPGHLMRHAHQVSTAVFEECAGFDGDRRIKLLRITADGARLLRQVKPAVRHVQERLLAPLVPRDRDAIAERTGGSAQRADAGPVAGRRHPALTTVPGCLPDLRVHC